MNTSIQYLAAKNYVMVNNKSPHKKNKMILDKPWKVPYQTLKKIVGKCKIIKDKTVIMKVTVAQ